jgi:hypothetical protein
MQFLKKHYEKVLLSIVLLALAVAAAALPFQVASIRTTLDEQVTSVVRTTPKPFKPIDLTTNETAVKRFAGPIEVKLSGAHNVFNPVLWKKRASDGALFKITTGNEMGAGALEVTRIDELKLTVSFEPAPPAQDNADPRYLVTILRDPKPSPDKRTISPKTPKGELFTLQRVEGPLEAPEALILLLKEDKKDETEAIRVPKGQPYVRLIGYTADLRYPLSKQNFLRKRNNDAINIQGDPETYKIVAISQNEVVLSAKSTEKRTRLTLNTSPPVK